MKTKDKIIKKDNEKKDGPVDKEENVLSDIYKNGFPRITFGHINLEEDVQREFPTRRQEIMTSSHNELLDTKRFYIWALKYMSSNEDEATFHSEKIELYFRGGWHTSHYFPPEKIGQLVLPDSMSQIIEFVLAHAIASELLSQIMSGMKQVLPQVLEKWTVLHKIMRMLMAGVQVQQIGDVVDSVAKEKANWKLDYAYPAQESLHSHFFKYVPSISKGYDLALDDIKSWSDKDTDSYHEDTYQQYIARNDSGLENLNEVIDKRNSLEREKKRSDQKNLAHVHGTGPESRDEQHSSVNIVCLALNSDRKIIVLSSQNAPLQVLLVDEKHSVFRSKYLSQGSFDQREDSFDAMEHAHIDKNSDGRRMRKDSDKDLDERRKPGMEQVQGGGDNLTNIDSGTHLQGKITIRVRDEHLKKKEAHPDQTSDVRHSPGIVQLRNPLDKRAFTGTQVYTRISGSPRDAASDQVDQSTPQDEDRCEAQTSTENRSEQTVPVLIEADTDTDGTPENHEPPTNVCTDMLTSEEEGVCQSSFIAQAQSESETSDTCDSAEDNDDDLTTDGRWSHVYAQPTGDAALLMAESAHYASSEDETPSVNIVTPVQASSPVNSEIFSEYFEDDEAVSSLYQVLSSWSEWNHTAPLKQQSHQASGSATLGDQSQLALAQQMGSAYFYDSVMYSQRTESNSLRFSTTWDRPGAAGHNHFYPQTHLVNESASLTTQTASISQSAASFQPGTARPQLLPITVHARGDIPPWATKTPHIDLTQAANPEMANLLSRRATFHHGWPADYDQDPAILSLAGFYYTGYGRRLRCWCCGVIINDLDPWENPWEEHARHSPSCRYLIEMKGEDFIARARGWTQDRPGVAGHPPTHLMNEQASITTQTASVSQSGASSQPGTARPQLQPITVHAAGDIPPWATKTPRIDLTQAANPEMANLLSRRATFHHGWPADCDQDPAILSLAGFYYTGYGRRLRCWCCGATINDLDPWESPWEEHARHSPSCRYLIEMKGEDFIA